MIAVCVLLGINVAAGVVIAGESYKKKTAGPAGASGIGWYRLKKVNL